MPARSRIVFTSLAVAALIVAVALPPSAQSQVGSSASPVITQKIDPSKSQMLLGNMRPEATAVNDRGAIGYDSPLEHLLLQLKRSPAQEQALRQYIDDLHKPASPNYHRWLTAQEFGQRFGLAKQDLDTITSWLESYGLKVNLVYPSGLLIDFSGTAGQVHQAFHAEIHSFDVNGVKHFANATDPQIPAALAPAVAGVVSLHDFMPHAMHQMRPAYTFTAGGFQYQAVVPGDLAAIYNLNPLFSAATSGQGQTIVVIEDTNVYSTADWTKFRSTFGLSGYTGGSFTQVHPAPPTGTNNCADPGVNGDDIEAILDAEYASAAAPSAAIELASCANTSTFGGLIALQNLLNGASPPPIVSISYGECEAVNGAASNAAYNSAYQQAVAEGVSVFVSSGDAGAAGCDQNANKGTHGVGVNAFASTPYNVAVGGTDFGDSYAGTNTTYWNTANTSTFASALSYVPEIPWNDSCAGVLLASAFGFSTTYGSGGFCNSSIASTYGYLTTAGGSGGPSGCATGSPAINKVVGGTCAGYAKPSWQSLVGNPADGVRDIPDVSLFAANGVWGHYYLFCYSDPANGGTPCTGAPSGWSGAGGTSFAAPIVAGVQALVNQRTGSRWGNPNPTYYSLAAAEYGASGNSSCNSTLGLGAASSCVFYDVTQGDIDVNCTGPQNCYTPSGANGVLSTSNSAYAPAFGTTTGWDFATGIGTLNAANLVNGWPSLPTQNFSISASPASVTITQGGAPGTSTVTVTATNGFSGSVSLVVTGCPPGATCSLPTPVSPAPAATSTFTITPTAGTSTGTFTLTITGTSGALIHPATVTLTVNPLSGPPALLLIHADASEVTGTGNGSIITPAVAPAGFTGTVVVKGTGSATFAPAQSGNGVYFLNCCANTNNAYYKFTGTTVGNIFNVSQAQVSFYLISRYSFAQRQGSAATSRYAFDVRDASQHLYYFRTQTGSGRLLFTYAIGGVAQAYYLPVGMEDTLFGNGVALKVTLSWGSTGSNLYLNDGLVKSTTYTQPTPSWTAASNFDLGAYEYLTSGGYNVSDDIIDEFTVTGPAINQVPPALSITSPAAGATVSGTTPLTASGTSLTGVQFQIDGNNLGAVVSGAGPTYSTSWDTTTVTNGTHTIGAVAVGASLNTSISVTVSNPLIPPVITNVMATSITSTSATITWTTDQSSNSQVAYGISNNPYSSTSPLNGALVTSHSVNLSQLTPSTTYHFQVLSQNLQGALATSADFTFPTPASTGPQPLLLIHADASEVTGLTNGSVITPAVAPTGFTGTVVVKGTGSANFAPAQTGNGVYFLACCANTNNAYYKFAGAGVGSLFNRPSGQITFYLKSRYTFAQRLASASAPRYAFDARDGNSTHQYLFYTRTSGTSLMFTYIVGGVAQYYFAPAGTEDTLFGNGVTLQVKLTWSGSTMSLYLNGNLVKSSAYTPLAASWSAASNFDLGAYEYLTSGGYNVSDDIIDEFTVN